MMLEKTRRETEISLKRLQSNQSRLVQDFKVTVKVKKTTKKLRAFQFDTDDDNDDEGLKTKVK